LLQPVFHRLAGYPQLDARAVADIRSAALARRMSSTTRAWPPDLAERLADYVTALRRRADLSQRELAALAGVPASTVARLESGATTDPRLSTMAKLAAAAGHRLVMAAADDELLMPEPELRGRCRDLRGRRLPAHLDVAPAVEDWLRPWWVPKRGEFTFIRNRGRRDEVRAERRDMIERYLADRDLSDRDLADRDLTDRDQADRDRSGLFRRARLG
jgi:transcriptional regulator with XRE-family HTH domain